MLDLNLSNRGNLSRYEYLYRQIRDAIVSGTLAPEQRLPSKRQLAQRLGCSLITVETALGQLAAEGYVQARPRSGYYVKDLGRLPRPTAEAISSQVDTTAKPRSAHPRIDTSRLPARPDRSALLLWEKSLRHVLSAENLDEAFDSLTPQGLPRLQADIARLLEHTRGMHVWPEQIVVGAGAQVLYQLVALLTPSGATCAVEDPGFPRIARTYEAQGKRVVHVALDHEGISMEGLQALDATLVHVMPSHQFPTGRVTSVARRYELLGWAAQRPGRLIVEDDYDCEFRMEGRPIPALASIDATGSVVYIGTFSKSLGPVVRAAYAVLPPALCQRYEGLRSFVAGTLGTIDQLALATMLENGSYEGHVARYRRQVRQKRDLLAQALAERLGDRMELEEADSGLHMVLAVALGRQWKGREREAEQAVARYAAQQGVALAPLSSYAALPYGGDGKARFVLQYERLSAVELETLVEAINLAVAKYVKRNNLLA
ncbi:MAG: PLP-dependent aminotransferase family protein [Coriobacteriales bacterium]|nr:PLP-dependent aminotransferase family protein [Coriobacteriales bacterium]